MDSKKIDLTSGLSCKFTRSVAFLFLSRLHIMSNILYKHISVIYCISNTGVAVLPFKASSSLIISYILN